MCSCGSNSKSASSESKAQEKDEVSFPMLSDGLKAAANKYTKILPFRNDFACVYDAASDCYGFINTKGKEIIPVKYHKSELDFSEMPGDGEVERFISDGVVAFPKDGKFVIIDTLGNEMCTPYYYIGNFKDGVAAATIQEPYCPPEQSGFIDTKGNWINHIELYPGDAHEFLYHDGLVGLDNGFYDIHGRLVIPRESSFRSFSHGKVLLSDYEGSVFCYDNQGNLLWTIKAHDATQFNDGMAAFYIDSKNDDYHSINANWGFVDSNGKVVIAPQYCFSYADGEGGVYALAPEFNDGYAVMMKSDGKGGVEGSPSFYDKKGKKVFTEYIPANNFSDGYAAVVKDEKIGFIDTEGKLRIPYKYDVLPWERPAFSEGFAVVYLNGKSGIVDKYGNDSF